jgi:DMSO/TMAO reductase YedYZ molybdopterin-dependent catalytic subunit
MNGRDLPKENGATNRKGAPIEQGYKQSKWVKELIVTSHVATGKIWDLNGLGDDNR